VASAAAAGDDEPCHDENKLSVKKDSAPFVGACPPDRQQSETERSKEKKKAEKKRIGVVVNQDQHERTPGGSYRTIRCDLVGRCWPWPISGQDGPDKQWPGRV
jgi:hypothetical protein